VLSGSLSPCKVGPCHHSMARPQVADGGTASSYGRSQRIYLITSRGQLTRGDPQLSGLDEVLRTPHHKNLRCYEKC
jgi:hypothetical protein